MNHPVFIMQPPVSLPRPSRFGSIVSGFLLSLGLVFCLQQPAAATKSQLLKIEGKTFATLEYTRSEDGLAVLAIALTPLRNGVKPVDWSEYEGGDGLGRLIDDKEWTDASEAASNPKADYAAETRLILGNAKKSIPLNFSAHGALLRFNGSVGAHWSKVFNAEQYGLLIANARLGNMEVSALRISAGQVSETPLGDLLHEAMLKELKAFYGTKLNLHEHFRFEPCSAITPDGFTVQCINCQKSMESTHNLLMRVKFSGDRWRVEKLGKNSGPQVSDADFKNADLLLNKVYKEVVQSLPARDLDFLKSSQRAWIRDRDEAVKDALKFAKLRSETPEGRALRNQVMHGYTESRVEYLKQWGR